MSCNSAACSFLPRLKALTTQRPTVQGSVQSLLPAPTDFASYHRLFYFVLQISEVISFLPVVQAVFLNLPVVLFTFQIQIPFKKKKSCFDRDLKLHPSQEINNKCSQSNLTLPHCSHSRQYSSVFHSKPEWHRAAQQLLAAALLSCCQIQTQDCWISSSFCSWTPDADCCASRCNRWFPRRFPQRSLWALSSKMTGRRRQQPRDYACASRKYVMEAKEIRSMGVL